MLDKRKSDRTGLNGNSFNTNNSFGVPTGASRAKLLEDLHLKHINSNDFDAQPEHARFFVIKSYSDEDVHKSIKYGVWSSTAGGTKRLSTAFEACQVSI